MPKGKKAVFLLNSLSFSCGSRLTSLSLFHCKSTGSVPPPRTYEKGQVNESDDDDTDDEEDREFLKKRKEEREKAAEEERKRKEAAENADAAILENGGAPAASATSEKEAISSLIFSGMDNQGFSLIAKACVQLTFLDVGMNGGVDDFAVDMITRWGKKGDRKYYGTKEHSFENSLSLILCPSLSLSLFLSLSLLFHIEIAHICKISVSPTTVNFRLQSERCWRD